MMPRTRRRKKTIYGQTPPAASSSSEAAAATMAEDNYTGSGVAAIAAATAAAAAAAASPTTTNTTTRHSKKRAARSSITPNNNNSSNGTLVSSSPVVQEKRAYRYRSSCPQALKDRLMRARQQRMYLITKTEQQTESSSLSWNFALLGSTGNIYDATLGHVPTCTCPDYAKRGDLCKHLIFVLLRVVGLSPDDPLAYQKAYLSSELQDMFDRMKQRERRGRSDSVIMANEQVRAQYSQLGKAAEAVKRQSLEQDCPICMEDLTNCPLDQVTYCKAACGMNFHTDCINQWRRAGSDMVNRACPNCRSVEGQHAGTATSTEGFVNLGRLQGQSPERDTSTYHDRYLDSSFSGQRKRSRRRF